MSSLYDVSVIIVNYNTLSITKSCIDSILKYTSSLNYEIILVDNASSDGSKEIFERDNRIKYLYNDSNVGFGRANNIGAKKASGKYLFLLNSDTLLMNNVINEMYQFMECNKEISACGVNLLDANHKTTYSHGKFPSVLEEFSSIGFLSLYRQFYNNKLSLAQKISEGNINDVDYISGADIFIRSEVFNMVEGFDYDYFMYYEETDLFYRLKCKGYKFCILPELEIIHLEGGSFNKPREEILNINRFKMQFNSKILYFKKHKPIYQIYLVKLFSILKYLIRPHIYRRYFKQLFTIIINTK